MKSVRMLEIVKGKNAHVTSYSDGQLWYKTDDGFEFPVPVGDINEVGNATFKSTEKAILLMRYIRKHINFIEKARTEQSF